ncbi:hypothetical protein ACFWJT_15710 [Streptomyces sp. NPDC127069]|uniref:hypothetical protein n=1 Tax=Streptomyces sp. NPDC127069 TaxID=3347128 RepID=UPI00365CDE54
MAEITVARRTPEQSTPPRLRIAVGRKTGAGPLVLDPPMSQADIDAHLKASHVRPAAKQVA